jgi:hypothetical protein
MSSSRPRMPEGRRPGSIAAAIATVALALLFLLALPAGALAADITGTWELPGEGGTECGVVKQTWTITAGTGAIAGHGEGGAYKWPMEGQVSGSNVEIKTPYEGGGYVAYFVGEVSADGNTMSGTWSPVSYAEAKKSSCTWLAHRKSGAPPPTEGPKPKEEPKTCNPLMGTCSPELVACVGFWAEDCSNLIPRPQPPLACISAFEDCTGFGGGKPGKPGEIDLSGFPENLKATVACDQKTGAVGGLGISSPVTECEIEGHLEANNPDPQADKLITYTENLRIFQGTVELELLHLQDAVVSTMYLKADPGTSMGTTSEERAAHIFRGAMNGALKKVFDQAKTAGKPVDTSATFDVHPFCGHVYSLDPKFCERLQTNVQKYLTLYLTRLQKEKHKWGLDEPEPSASGASLGLTGQAARSAHPRKRGKGPRTLVIAAGGVSVRNGKTGTLTLKVSRAALKHLKTARKHGKRTLTAIATINATVIPGLASTRTVSIKVSLVPTKKHRHGGHRRAPRH